MFSMESTLAKNSSPTFKGSLRVTFASVWNSSRLMEFNNGEILLGQPTPPKPRLKNQILCALFLEQMELRMLFTAVTQYNQLRGNAVSSSEETLAQEQ